MKDLIFFFFNVLKMEHLKKTVPIGKHGRIQRLVNELATDKLLKLKKQIEVEEKESKENLTRMAAKHPLVMEYKTLNNEACKIEEKIDKIKKRIINDSEKDSI